MNALVALCHFCELHGPRTLFCTEALHPPSPSPSSQAGVPVHGDGDRDRDGDREGEGLTMRANSSASQRGEMCDGCRSLPASHPGFVSIDDETGIRFLSPSIPDSHSCSAWSARPAYAASAVRCVPAVKGQFSLEMSSMVLCFHTPSLSKTASPGASSDGTVLSW